MIYSNDHLLFVYFINNGFGRTRRSLVYIKVYIISPNNKVQVFNFYNSKINIFLRIKVKVTRLIKPRYLFIYRIIHAIRFNFKDNINLENLKIFKERYIYSRFIFYNSNTIYFEPLVSGKQKTKKVNTVYS